uniref:Uncharacterized protein n=1 Tax=Haptolina brevifila TaxID=156173 RepID=A0A7S2N1C4_9EUKA
MPELGLGEAEILCILTAWKRHMTLMENAKKYEQMADGIQILLYGVGVLTTILAVMFSLEAAAADKAAALEAQAAAAADRMLSEAGNASSGDGEDAGGGGLDGLIAGMTPLELVMVMLPIISTLLGTVRSKVRPREKWSTCLMAAYQIVDQIYKYRLRTDAYDPTPPPPEEGEEPIPPKVMQTKVRENFVETTKSIYTFAVSTEVSKGGALRIGKMGRKDTQNEGERTEFLAELRKHVDTRLFGMEPTKDKSKPTRKEKRIMQKTERIQAALAAASAAAEAAGGQLMSAVEEAIDPSKKEEDKDKEEETIAMYDDFQSVLDIDVYMECRVRPIAAYLEKRAPVMSSRFNASEAVSLAANTVGAVLAVLSYAEWVAMTVAVATNAIALQDYFFIPRQLEEANRAFNDVHGLITWWDSLSLVQKKTPSVKRRCANTCETAVLGLCSARTGIAASLPNQKEEGGDDDA